jgi:Fic family protein
MNPSASIDTRWDIKPDTAKALMLAQRELAVFVCDAVNLEGIPFTLPEIQTLLDGITVGGHKLSDQQIAINQAEAWRFVFSAIKQQRFRLDKAFACQLHGIAAKEEALHWGTFRTGSVSIAGTDYRPPPHESLDSLFDDMVVEASRVEDIYDRAIQVFLRMARIQFFYDVNKRMGRFLMNGILLSHGYPAINLPAKRQLEFNQLMLEFYASGNESAMNELMRSCLDRRTLEIMGE